MEIPLDGDSLGWGFLEMGIPLDWASLRMGIPQNEGKGGEHIGDVTASACGPLVRVGVLGDDEVSLTGCRIGSGNVVLAQEDPQGFLSSWDASSGTLCGIFQALYPCGFHIFLVVDSPISQSAPDAPKRFKHL